LADHYLNNGDQEKGIQMLKEAGKKGCTQSMFVYAELAEQEGNDEEAYQNYRTCMFSITESYYKLGKMSARGYPEQSFANALTYYRAGAELNNINCLLELGSTFINFFDFIAERNLSEQNFIDTGVNYLNMAVELGSSRAAVWSGDYYFQIKKYDKAIEMYQKAFELGDPDAYVFLAEMYVIREDIKKDTPKALMYLGKALDAGSKIAEDSLKLIMEKVKQLDDLPGVH
jgi:TPR repeat protein